MNWHKIFFDANAENDISPKILTVTRQWWDFDVMQEIREEDGWVGAEWYKFSIASSPSRIDRVVDECLGRDDCRIWKW